MPSRSFQPPPRSATPAVVLTVLVLALLAAALWWWWQQRSAGPVVPVPVPVAEAPAPARPPAAAASPPAAAVVPEPAVPAEPLTAGEAVPALQALLGRDAVLRLLQTGDLPRRIVATVDNLARDSAPAAVWPVNPAADRFRTIQGPDGALQADPDNGLRYTPLVLLAESVDPQALAGWYRRALPLLQQAYEDLGYPGRRFHARLVEVLDHLLATPPAPQPLRLTLTEVQGPVPSTRPWVRYEFADPAMERASAGRKILWRVGPVNQRRLMKALAGFRAALG